MKQRTVVLSLVIGLAIVLFSAEIGFGKNKGLRRLDLPGRSDTRPFTHTIVAGDTVYIAGSLGRNTEGQIPEDPMEEVRFMMDSMKAKLELADATMSDLVSVQVFCSDISLYGAFNEVYASYFEKGEYPVRAFIGSGELLAGARFEINGIAYKR